MECIYGPLAKELPDGFAPPEMWPEFPATARPVGICRRELVGTPPRGVRWSLWPLTFEEYVGDDAPDFKDSDKGKLAYNRLVMWRRITPVAPPPSWRAWAKGPWRLDGFYTLVPGADYTRDWQHNARRDLKQWHEHFADKGYIIETISFDEFKKTYQKNVSVKKAGLELFYILERTYRDPSTHQHLQLLGVRNTKSSAVVAGTALLYSPTHRASVRYCPFMLPEGRLVYASTALIDHWYRDAQKKNSTTLFFTSFWHQGLPKSWKGFSAFKSHFGLQYVFYPPTLYRFVGGKFF